jgi:hypothetical protein
VFRRRKSKDRSERHDEGQYDEDQYQDDQYDEDQYDDEADWDSDDPDIEESAAESRPQEPAPVRAAEPVRDGGGPWDAAEPFPERDRVDLGSLRVPVGSDYEIQLFMGPEHGAWVTARRGESELQMQAFAASRSDALWDDVRAEIAAEVQGAGGSSTEVDGPFGVALVAEVPVEPGQPASGMRTVRFVGVDGPRWFLRGLFGGPAALGGPAAFGGAAALGGPAALGGSAALGGPAAEGSGADTEVLEGVFRDVVVSRGDHPVPPRDLLELRLPPDAQQALQEQMAAQQQEEQNRFRGDLNPFERGPEITETR